MPELLSPYSVVLGSDEGGRGRELYLIVEGVQREQMQGNME